MIRDKIFQQEKKICHQESQIKGIYDSQLNMQHDSIMSTGGPSANPNGENNYYPNQRGQVPFFLKQGNNQSTTKIIASCNTGDKQLAFNYSDSV